ncbi:putative DDE Tnp4 domain-containing protein [Phytophthora infestans]|uniref:Putative DDE Tnp4 domain-containing protein n=1 Tax=Phytophthora infestans TaxID=4787 RepID=A0A8S9U4Q3_PHYIN|nr:putative DDE Tnp4 domain-containing protein [Phytophthora infestans]
MGKRDADEKEARFLILALSAMKYEAEAVALYTAEFMHHQDLSWQCTFPRVRFSLNDHDRSACRRLFRFESHEIRQILPFSNLPNEIYTSQGCVVPREEAFCLLLRRLMFPARLADLRCEFGRSPGALSSTINTTASLIYDGVRQKMILISVWLNDTKGIQQMQFLARSGVFQSA